MMLFNENPSKNFSSSGLGNGFCENHFAHFLVGSHLLSYEVHDMEFADICAFTSNHICTRKLACFLVRNPESQNYDLPFLKISEI
jgi:hypothetical protein